MELNQNTVDAKIQFNELFSNMFVFSDDDMSAYDFCYENVFKTGINFSYMSCVFYAQYAAEILVGLLASNPFRKYLIGELDDEANRPDDKRVYWEESMNVKRYGREGIDYSEDTKQIMAMANVSFEKIRALNEWYGTKEGQAEFDNYCLSKKAVKDIKRIICEFPHLMRRYDYDQNFANEIMEYAGIVMVEMMKASGETDNQ